MKTKIAVLFGGQSSEYPVSLMSVTSVLQNLNPAYETYLVGITPDGIWYHYSGTIEDITADKWAEDPANEEVLLSTNPHVHGFVELNSGKRIRIDAVLPIMHGRNAEDGTIQGLCQLANIPCCSDDMVTCAIAIDKEFTHIVAESHGVPMARYVAIHKDQVTDNQKLFTDLSEHLGLPFYIKPSREGSSFGAHKIDDLEDFLRFLPDSFKYDNKILAEEFIAGHEVGCGVLGKNQTGELYEVVVETEMYGYAEKYDGYKTNIYVPARSLTPEQVEEVKRLSLIVYKALNCKMLARIDFFAGDRIIFNELNMIPGFTSHSLYPAMFVAAGMSYSQLLDNIIALALKGQDQ